MPDHVHLLLKPLATFDLVRVMMGIKGASARLLNKHRKTTGRVWQQESWDRIIRDVAEFDEKLQYMYDNPVKAGLVVDGSTYEGWFINPDFA